jgi:hypothetical protein
MLWRMSADSRARKLGIMSHHRVRKVCAKRPSRPAAGRRQPVPHPPRGSGNGANCPNVLSPRLPGSLYGTQEFLFVHVRSCAISCRTPTVAGRSGIGWGRAERAERSETPGTRQLPAALTPRTPLPRLPALCLSGPFRSELSARSADRGRVVPVLDRFSGRSPIAPFAPSFP